MAERKPYGQEYADAMKRGLRSLYENENVQDFGRGLVNNPLSKGITRFVIDPVAELGTRAASAKGILPFLPDSSLLTLLTPEVTADRETRESIDADITQYPTIGERLEKRGQRFRADVGAFGEFLFGDVRNAGENLNAGVKFANLPPEQKIASRFFLLDIVPLPGVGPAAKAGAKATKELENLELLKSQMVTRDGSMGAADVKGMLTNQLRNTVGDVGDDEIQYLASFYNDLPPEIQTQVSGLLNQNELKKLNTLINPNISAFEKTSGINPKQFTESLNSPNAVQDDKTLQNFANYYDQYLYQTKANEPGKVGSRSKERLQNFYSSVGDEQANKLITAAEEKGLLQVRDISPGAPKIKPEGEKYIKDNFGTMSDEMIRENMNKNLGKYFYTDVGGNRYNVDTASKLRGYATRLGLAKGDSNLRLIKNKIIPVKDEFDKILASKEIDVSNPFAVKEAFREAVIKIEGRSTDTMGDKFYDFLDTRRKAYNDTDPDLKILSRDELTAYKGGDKHATQVLKYYQNKFAKNKTLKDLNESTEFRFFNNIERTEPDLSIEEFFSSYKPKDIKKGGKLYDKYKRFEQIDKTRKEAGEVLKPILDKIFKKLRVGTPAENKINDVKTSLQIAHKYITQGIGKNFVGKDKIGTGADPAQLIIDISEYNAYMQSGLESQARIYYNRYARNGLESDYQKLLEIDNAMKTIGVQGEIAPGQTIGRAMPIDEKLSGLMIEAMDAGALTQSEVDRAILAADIIADNKQEYVKMFGEVADFNKGGIVNAADVQYAAPGGFFSKMFGKPPPYLKEEISKTDIFTPTIKQKATLEALGPEATAINPGQVFYSNLELSLSKPNSPVKFDSEKEFYDYINAAGIGRDEVSDARIGPYVSAKAKSGEPILSQDIIQITSESPLNQLTTEGFGFGSDKINIAKSDIPERYDAPAIERGQPVFKEARYAGTGLMPGYLPGSYRERVLKIDSDKFRGDPGTLPSGASGHNFGDNYTLAWGRATDRPAIINPGETVDKATGTIINPLAVTDTKKLQDIEAKIQSLVDDPLTNVDPDDFQTISQAVNALVERSGGRLSYDKAKQAVDAQIVQKQKQLRKLQSQFVDEEKRLESIKDVRPQNVTMTFIDEIQSDIAQAATRKARELAIKLDVMAEQGVGIEAMEQGINRDLMQFFADNRSVARPVGATKLELMPQYNELMAFQKQFSEMGKKPPYALTPQDFAMYENFKKRQTEIIDSMADEISGQLMKALYPDVPLKDRGAWSDAVLKQQLYEAAHRLFVEKDPKAPTYLGVASGDIVAGKAYNQAGDTSMDINDRILDKQNRINQYKDRLRQDINTTASLGNSQYPGVGTHEFYGGPKSRAWNEETNQVGGHYTSDIERSMRKYADDNNSKMVVANVAVGESRSETVYNIINQTTGDVVGQGDTYRQAEAIANDLVDNAGGRYKIKKERDKNFESEPVFAIELTKEMLQLNKIYK